MKKLILAFAMLALITGCASSTDDYKNHVFNGDTPAVMKADIHQVFTQLPRHQKTKFFIALMEIQLPAKGTPQHTQVIDDPAKIKIDYALLSKKIDGLTYQQVLELAEKSPVKGYVHTVNTRKIDDYEL